MLLDRIWALHCDGSNQERRIFRKPHYVVQTVYVLIYFVEILSFAPFCPSESELKGKFLLEQQLGLSETVVEEMSHSVF